MGQYPLKQRRTMPSDGALNGVVCAGLFSSGSTWVFNVTADLLRSAGGRGVIPFYADDIDETALRAIEEAERFVLKTHTPAASVRALCWAGRLPVLLTVRDPRDAVASLMKRFGRDFALALDQVERSANLMHYLFNRVDPLVLKYEDQFIGVRGVAAISAYLATPVSTHDQRRIADAFSRDVVARRIEDLLTQGVLLGNDPSKEWETGTHWHPFHVGDGQVGKYHDILTTVEVEQVAYATRRFCQAFDYAVCQSAHPTPRAAEDGAEVSIDGWVDRFISPDLVSGWVRCSVSRERVELTARHNGRIIGSTVANLYRSDLAATVNGGMGFQLKLTVPVTLRELVQDTEICAVWNGSTLGHIKPTVELVTCSLSSR